MKYDRAAMKLEVKQAMKQARPHPMLVTLLFGIIVGVGTSLISQLTSRLTSLLFGNGLSASLEELVNGVMNYGDAYLNYYLEQVLTPQFIVAAAIQVVMTSLVIGILTTVWTGLMDAGYAGYCLDMARGANPELGRIFCGFPRAGSVILAYILVAIFTTLWSMLFSLGLIVLYVVAFVLISMGDAMIIVGLLLMLAAYVGFFIGLLWTVLRYAMVPYAVIDSQNNLSAMDAIRTSISLMKGRKGSFFVLQFSFIGWYLLEALIELVGFIIVVAVSLGSILSYADSFEDALNSFMTGSSDESIQLLAQMLGPALLVALLVLLACSVGIFILNLWLTPYRAGCNARFYVYATGGQPSQPVQPIQPGPYQPGPYQPGPYGGQPGPYGSQSGPYGSQSGPYGSQPGPYGGQPGPYGSQPGPYGGQPGPYGGQPGPYGGQPGPYGGQPGGSYAGYTQVQQPPQYGEGTYPQRDASQPPRVPAYSVAEPVAAPAAPAAPQAPQAPAYPAAEPAAAPAAPAAPQAPQAPAYPMTEPLAAPAAPAAPEAPAVSEAPVVPEQFAPARLAEPIDDAPYEAPYAAPEEPGDDTPQQPGDSSFPQ